MIASGLGLVGYQVIKNQIIEEIGKGMYCVYIDGCIVYTLIN